MSWTAARPFAVVHEYPAHQSPHENHPEAYGRLLRKPVFLTDGTTTIEVRSTARRPDGWSYNVVRCKERAWWFSYFHNARTGKRVRYSGTSPPSTVEQRWGLERMWNDVAPL